MGLPEAGNVRYLYFAGILLILVDAGAYLTHLTHELPGFSALFGFVSAVFLIYLSSAAGKALKRDGDYYEKFRKVR